MKDVIVNACFFESQNDGLSAPIPVRPRFRCNIVFDNVPALSKYSYACRIAVDYYGKEIFPGEKIEGLVLNFMSSDEVTSHVSPGVSFSFWRGKVFGIGQVVSIRETELPREF